MPVLRSTYQALRDDYRKAVEDRDEAVKLAAERLTTITRLSTRIDELLDTKPDGPVRPPLPVQGDVELRRQLLLAQRTIRTQAARLDELQASHVADTRELHDLRQGVTS
ncbi:MAG: hypothetical protein HOV92_18035 [Streptomyces sp.]|nr:hypothetical protein [Streptomyces sp.]